MDKPVVIKTLALSDLRSGRATPEKIADDIVKYEKQEKYEVCQALKEALEEFCQSKKQKP